MTNPREAALERALNAIAAFVNFGGLEHVASISATPEIIIELRDALAALDALPAADSGWRPIADAPKDGQRIRCLSEGEIEWRESNPAALVSGGWHRVSEKDRVVGWLPLPPPPVPQENEE